MGNQQLLLLLLGLILVAVAVSVGIGMMRDWEEDSNRTDMLEKLEELRMDLCQFRMKPRTMGGGGGAMTGYVMMKSFQESDEWFMKTTKLTATEITVEAHSKVYPANVINYTVQENVGSPCKAQPTIAYVQNFGTSTPTSVNTPPSGTVAGPTSNPPQPPSGTSGGPSSNPPQPPSGTAGGPTSNPPQPPIGSGGTVTSNPPAQSTNPGNVPVQGGNGGTVINNQQGTGTGSGTGTGTMTGTGAGTGTGTGTGSGTGAGTGSGTATGTGAPTTTRPGNSGPAQGQHNGHGNSANAPGHNKPPH